MSREEILDLDLDSITEDDCILFLWATYPKLLDAIETIKAWGFEYKTVAFTWVKRNKKSDSWFWGLGYWTRANAELCLLATKGKPKSRTQQIINIRAKEGDDAFDDDTSLGSVAADVLEKEQIARNLKSLEREIDNKWGKGTFKKIELERSKRIAEKHKKQREKREEAQRKAEQEKSFWVKTAVETLKGIFLIGFIAGGVFLLLHLKDSQ